MEKYSDIDSYLLHRKINKKNLVVPQFGGDRRRRRMNKKLEDAKVEANDDDER